MKRAMLLALLLACGAAQASEWVPYVSGKTEFLVDTSSIRVEGAIRRTWSKSIPAPKTERGVGINSGKWVRYDLTHRAFNCSEESSKMDAITVFHSDGTNMIEDFPGAGWSPVRPDTIGYALMQFVCSWKLK